MKKILTGLAVVTALSTASFAESLVVDISVGGGSVTADTPTVAFGDSAITPVEMNLDKPSQTYMWAQFDHALPIIPNIRIEQNTLSYAGTASTSAKFNGIDINISNPGTIDLTNQDFIAYWGVPFSTWIPMIDEADFGIGIKQFDGKLEITGVTNETVDFMLPYGYAKLHVSPPFMFGIGLEAEIKVISGLGATFNESIFKLDWSVEAPIPVIDLEVGVEAGYRSTSIQYDADGGDAFLDLEFTGVFFGAFAKFGI